MQHETGTVASNAMVAGLATAASVVAVLAGVWMLFRQELYVNAGTDAFGVTERSLNWWGLGIGIGLMLGGLTGLLGLFLRGRILS